MNLNRGFTLITFVVYLFIFSLISCCMCSLSVNVLIPYLKKMQFYQLQNSLYGVIDLFVREIRNNKIILLKRIGPHDLEWESYHHKNIEWHYHEKTLKRIEITWDKNKKKTITSTVVASLDNAIFSIEYNNSKPVLASLTLFALGNRINITGCAAL